MRTLLLLSAVVVLSACGTSPMDFCRRNVDVTCEVLYRCSTEAERAVAAWQTTFGTDQANCVELQRAKMCPDNTNDIVCGRHPEWFDGAAGNACLDDIQRATCAGVNTAFQDSANCARVCVAR